MTCVACGADNRPDARFCRACGAPLARTCPNGHALRPDDRFCDVCGAPVAEPTAPETAGPSSERRLVSVLFADLVDFTALSEARDAEEVREILSGYFERMQAAIARCGDHGRVRGMAHRPGEGLRGAAAARRGARPLRPARRDAVAGTDRARRGRERSSVR